MKILLGIIGILLLIPIALVIVAAICTTLIGGYVALVFQLCWPVVAIGSAIAILVILVKKFL